MIVCDSAFMRMSLGLARRGLGRVWPNPAVGCVIVKNGRVIGRGWTQPGGRPHAETEALRRAGSAAVGATAYVTLEPCAHEGKTGPCCVALAEAGIARVVAALKDPDPRVASKGLSMLRDAGIDVTVGLLADEAYELNKGFFLKVTARRPLVTWKIAASMDGRVAAADGDSKWITGARARAHGHFLRASHDAILVGSGTALTDDPALTCRLPGLMTASPVRVVADRRLRLSSTSVLVRSAREHPVWVITAAGADPDRAAALRELGVEVLVPERMPDNAGAGPVSPADMCRLLASKGITRLLIEGGGTLAAAFVAAGLVDDIVWFQAPKLIGGDGLAAAGPLGVIKIAGAYQYSRVRCEPLAEDTMTHYVHSIVG